jgi:hypothetical protein
MQEHVLKYPSVLNIEYHVGNIEHTIIHLLHRLNSAQLLNGTAEVCIKSWICHNYLTALPPDCSTLLKNKTSLPQPDVHLLVACDTLSLAGARLLDKNYIDTVV